MPETHTGGCHCGYLRYAVAAPLDDVAHCHCSICRRTTGGIVTTWATVPRAAFRWLAGEAAEYASSASCTRYFCPRCGANLALFTRLSADTLTSPWPASTIPSAPRQPAHLGRQPPAMATPRPAVARRGRGVHRRSGRPVSEDRSWHL